MQNTTSIFRKGEALIMDLAAGGHWFGHGFNHVQPFPLETGEIVNTNFAVNNIQSPIWLCSAGCAILAETTAPLDVRINEHGDGKLRISCPSEPLQLRVFKGENLPEARAALMIVFLAIFPAEHFRFKLAGKEFHVE